DGLAGDGRGVGVGDEEAGGARAVGGRGVDAGGADAGVDGVGQRGVVEPFGLVVDVAGLGHRVVVEGLQVQDGQLPGGQVGAAGAGPLLDGDAGAVGRERGALDPV